MSETFRRGAAALGRDAKYFFLILLMMATIAVLWVPVEVLGLFLGDRPRRAVMRFFLLFE
jgi:hypothetical protein